MLDGSPKLLFVDAWFLVHVQLLLCVRLVIVRGVCSSRTYPRFGFMHYHCLWGCYLPCESLRVKSYRLGAACSDVDFTQSAGRGPISEDKKWLHVILALAALNFR